jgi:hypothetical protein
LPAPLRARFTPQLSALLEADVEADRVRGGGKRAERHWIHLDVQGHPGRVVEAVVESYAALVEAFRAGDVKAQVAALGDLSHFVADLHQPLHVTSNHTGEATGNCIAGKNSAHSRFEREFVDHYQAEIEAAVQRQPRHPVVVHRAQIARQAMKHARAAHALVRRLLAADRAAMPTCDERRSRGYLDEVKAAWLPMVTAQMGAAAGWLADLVVSAQREAGQR